MEEPMVADVVPLSPIGLLAALVLTLGEVTVYELDVLRRTHSGFVLAGLLLHGLAVTA
jgi:hypothetical protein